jgi:hypothetical protein
MKKIVLAVFVPLLLSLSCFPIPAQQFALTIWVDKGCGGEYFVGDMLTVNWSVTHSCELTFWEIESDGFKRRLHSGPLITTAGQGSRGWTLKDYGYGKRAIYAEAVSIWGSDSAECEFYVRKKAADVEVTVLDQDGVPISGANVSLNGTSIATTDASGRITIPDVEFGEHTITVEVAGEEKSSRIRIATTQRQYLEFVFTVEKRGSIQVRVFDQNGAPIQNADVYLDGFKEGTTNSEGILDISTSEGSHFIEATWQNQTAEQSVTVIKNQTSFADLTIYIASETTLIVFVRDDTGNSLVDANVYLDTIFLGRTDTQGKVEQPVAPGFHTVRVEKQGYNPATQDTDVQEGKSNSVTMVITEEEEAPVYGILTVLGILLLLRRRKH